MPKSKDPLLCKLPPQNIDAEQALISAVLLDNRCLAEIFAILTPEDFYKPAHRRIFAAALALFKTGEPVDLVTLGNRLQSDGQLEATGGAAYLAAIVESAPLAVNASHYARIVHDKATLRCLLEQGNAIVARCLADAEDVEAVIDEVQGAIFKIAERRVESGFHTVEDLLEPGMEAIHHRQQNQALYTGVPSGFKDLDTLTSGFQNSDLVILAARPSMGKTALALNVARNAAVDGGIPVAFFSLEMSKEQLTMRLLSAEARLNSYNLRHGYVSRDDWQKLVDACGRLGSAPIYIDDASDTTAMKLRAKARRLKVEKKLGLIIIDYLQLMKAPADAERRDLAISEISRSLKGLAKDLNVPVIALSQLNRQLENRDDKSPRLADLRESGALEQDADVVIFIHREEVYADRKKKGAESAPPPVEGLADIIVAKQRNGPTDRIRLAYNRSCTRFENLAAMPDA